MTGASSFTLFSAIAVMLEKTDCPPDLHEEAAKTVPA
jgi:hypothetical protein